MENNLKTAIEHLNLVNFVLPVSNHNAGFGPLDYTEYTKDPNAKTNFKLIYQRLLYFGVVLTLNLNEGKTTQSIQSTIEDVEKSGKSEILRELKERFEEVDRLETLIPTYIRYMFYRAVAIAQNGVVYPYIGDDWDTEKLSQFMQEIAEDSEKEFN